MANVDTRAMWNSGATTSDIINAIKGGNSGYRTSIGSGLTGSTASVDASGAFTSALAGMNDMSAMMKRAAAQQQAFTDKVLPQITGGADKLFGAGDAFMPYAKKFLDRSEEYTGVEDKLIADATAGRMSQAEGMAGQAGADVRQQYASSRDSLEQQLMSRGITPGSSAWTQAMRGMAQDEAAQTAGAVSRTRRDEDKQAWMDTNNLRLGVMGLGNQVAGVGADLAKTGGSMYTAAGGLLGEAGKLNTSPMAAYADAMKGYGAIGDAGAKMMAATTEANRLPLQAYQVMNSGGPATANAVANTYGLMNPTVQGQNGYSSGGMFTPSGPAYSAWNQPGQQPAHVVGSGNSGYGSYGGMYTPGR